MLRGLIVLAAVPLAVLLALPGVASAKVVAFAHGYQLANSVMSVVHGSPDGAGGCIMPKGRMTLPLGQRAVEMREDSLNTATCDAVVEQGTPPASALRDDSAADTAAAGYGAAHAGGGLDAFGHPVAGTSRTRPRVQAYAAYAYGAGYEKDSWEDPIGIDVNKTISHERPARAS